jgi:hypothetical protein
MHIFIKFKKVRYNKGNLAFFGGKNNFFTVNYSNLWQVLKKFIFEYHVV